MILRTPPQVCLCNICGGCSCQHCSVGCSSDQYCPSGKSTNTSKLTKKRNPSCWSNHFYHQTPLEIPCSPAMFKTEGGAASDAAFWACKAQDSLQRNWFPDPIQVAAGSHMREIFIVWLVVIDYVAFPGFVLLPDLEWNGWILAEWSRPRDNGKCDVLLKFHQVC